MTAVNVEWLRERAESYWRDSQVFADNHDMTMAAAYRAIADELRRAADEVDQ